MKYYTDIEQSKKLAGILPIDSADMYYLIVAEDEYSKYPGVGDKEDILNELPCWSLAALLNVIPKYVGGSRLRMDMSKKDFSLWFDNLSSGIVDEILPDIIKDNPVDACYEMIVKLHEQKLL